MLFVELTRSPCVFASSSFRLYCNTKQVCYQFETTLNGRKPLFGKYYLNWNLITSLNILWLVFRCALQHMAHCNHLSNDFFLSSFEWCFLFIWYENNNWDTFLNNYFLKKNEDTRSYLKCMLHVHIVLFFRFFCSEIMSKNKIFVAKQWSFMK